MNDREQAFWERAFLAYLSAGELRAHATAGADEALKVWRERCPDLAGVKGPKAPARAVALECVADAGVAFVRAYAETTAAFGSEAAIFDATLARQDAALDELRAALKAVP